METHDEQFHPESVDEDIDQFLQIHGPKEIAVQGRIRLVHEVKDLYLEESQVLDRAWKRLSVQVQSAEQPLSAEDPISIQRYQRKRNNHYMKDKQFPGNKKNTFWKGLSGIGLGLVAALLIASMLVVLTHYWQSGKTTQTAASHTTPLVTGKGANSLYVTTAHGVKKLDAQKGKIDWSYQIPQMATMDAHLYQSGDTIFAAYKDAQHHEVLALNATSGHIVWQRTIAIAEAAVKENTTVALDGSTLYLISIYADPSYAVFSSVTALNIQTGVTLHTFPLLIDSDAISVTVVNNVIYVSGAYLSAYSASIGAKLWKTSAVSGQTFSTPHVNNGVISIVSDPQGAGGELYSINASRGTVIWKKHVNGGDSETPGDLFLVNGTIYLGIQGASSLYAFDAQTGNQIWSQNVNGIYMGGMVLDGNILYANGHQASGKSYIAALNAASGQIIQYVPVNASYGMGYFTVNNGVIYTYTQSGSVTSSTSDSYITALGLQGKTLWTLSGRSNFLGLLLAQ